MLPNLGPLEMLIVGGLAVMLFGKRLPEVGRSLGKGILEFKRGLNDVASGLDLDESSSGISGYSSSSSSTSSASASRYDRPAIESTPAESDAPKFEIPGAVSTTAAE